MAVPTHAATCATFLWKTFCRSCGDPVYFFGCSCGSKVFFDSPGPPWPLHGDRCIPYLVSQLRVEGLTLGEIENLIERRGRELGVPVAREVVLKLAKDRFAASGKKHVYPLILESTDAEFIGQIVAINPMVNVFRRLGLTEGPIAKSYLGDLARHPFSEITVRLDADQETGLQGELTALYPATKVKEQGLRVGAKVLTNVTVKILAGGHKICVYLEIYSR